MGYNARDDEIHDNVTRMRRQWEEERDALATWFWPKIKAALVSKHHCWRAASLAQ
jgi:hypothetical protein